MKQQDISIELYASSLVVPVILGKEVESDNSLSQENIFGFPQL